MALYVTVVRGANATDNTVIDADFLNQLGQPVVNIQGTIDGSGAVSVSPGTIGATELEDSVSGSTGVTNPKMAYMPAGTVKGNSSAVSAAPQDLNAAALRTILDVAADNVSLAQSGGVISVKDGGVSADKLATYSVKPIKIDARYYGDGTGSAETALTANSATLNCTNAATFRITPSASCTYQVDIPQSAMGQTFLAHVTAPGGSVSVSFTVPGGQYIKFKGGVAPSLPSTAGQSVIFTFVRFATTVYATQIGDFPA
jgi:hypothetical protein